MISVVVPLFNEPESLRHAPRRARPRLRARNLRPGRVPVRGRRQPRRLVGGHPGLARRRPRGPGHPVPPQLRQGGRAHRGVPGRPGRDRLHARRRPPGRPRRDPPVPRASSTRGSTSSAAGSGPRHDPWHKVYPSRVFNWMVSTPDRLPAPRPQLRLQGLPRRGPRARSASTASCTGSSRSWLTPEGSGSARSRSTTAPGDSARRSTGSRGSSRGSSTW